MGIDAAYARITCIACERTGRGEMAVSGLVCRECGRRYPAEAIFVCEQCFGPLEVEYDHSKLGA